MHKFLEVAPGLVLVWVSLTAAIPAQIILRASGRGRARSAIAYLSGFFLGIGASVLLFALLRLVAAEAAPEIGSIGLAASFVGPLIGMVRAKWLGPVRRRSRAVRASAASALVR